MSTFKADRDLVVGLTDRDAHTVLGLLDGGLTHHHAPSEFAAALEAVRRSPDVSRYFLVEKTQKYVAAKYQFAKGVKRRTKKRERFSRRAD